MRACSAISYSRDLLIEPTALRPALTVKARLLPTGGTDPLELGQRKIRASLKSHFNLVCHTKWSTVHTFASAQWK